MPDRPELPSLTELPCSWAALRRPHPAHSWLPQPGMPVMQCPGRPAQDTAADNPWVAIARAVHGAVADAAASPDNFDVAPPADDDEAREQYAAAVRAAHAEWLRPGSDAGQRPLAEHLTDAVLAVRDTEMEQLRAALVRVRAECDAIEADVYGQHDEDDDGMREAVRRIRAALDGEVA